MHVDNILSTQNASKSNTPSGGGWWHSTCQTYRCISWAWSGDAAPALALSSKFLPSSVAHVNSHGIWSAATWWYVGQGLGEDSAACKRTSRWSSVLHGGSPGSNGIAFSAWGEPKWGSLPSIFLSCQAASLWSQCLQAWSGLGGAAWQPKCSPERPSRSGDLLNCVQLAAQEHSTRRCNARCSERSCCGSPIRIRPLAPQPAWCPVWPCN